MQWKAFNLQWFGSHTKRTLNICGCLMYEIQARQKCRDRMKRERIDKTNDNIVMWAVPHVYGRLCPFMDIGIDFKRTNTAHYAPEFLSSNNCQTRYRYTLFVNCKHNHSPYTTHIVHIDIEIAAQIFQLLRFSRWLQCFMHLPIFSISEIPITFSNKTSQSININIIKSKQFQSHKFDMKYNFRPSRTLRSKTNTKLYKTYIRCHSS